MIILRVVRNTARILAAGTTVVAMVVAETTVAETQAEEITVAEMPAEEITVTTTGTSKKDIDPYGLWMII